MYVKYLQLYMTRNTAILQILIYLRSLFFKNIICSGITLVGHSQTIKCVDIHLFKVIEYIELTLSIYIPMMGNNKFTTFTDSPWNFGDELKALSMVNSIPLLKSIYLLFYIKHHKMGTIDIKNLNFIYTIIQYIICRGVASSRMGDTILDF